MTQQLATELMEEGILTRTEAIDLVLAKSDLDRNRILNTIQERLQKQLDCINKLIIPGFNL
jgi:hypothetical protein